MTKAADNPVMPVMTSDSLGFTLPPAESKFEITGSL
jgi:hypothetical protein